MRFTCFLLLALLASCATYNPEKTYKLTILHTNDHHGRFWQNKEGEWGLAARATLVRRLRAEARAKGHHVLLLDAGDVNTGTPQSDMLDAEPDFRGMALLGYDAMAVGNHEFDNHLTVIREQERWAGFPFLSANIYERQKRLFKPVLYKNLGGLNVAIMGLTTKDTPVVSTMGAKLPIDFRDPIDEAARLVPQLRQEAQVVIALTHMGHYPDERHHHNSPGDVTLARRVPGIDVIVGGHTQQPLFKPDIQNGAVIVQAHEWGKYVGKVELEHRGGKTRLLDYRLVPVNHKGTKERIAEDTEMLQLLAPFQARGDMTLKVKIGHTKVPLAGDRSLVRNQETTMAKLVTNAYRAKFNADLAITNGGSVRDGIPAGDITYEHVLTVLPFGNEMMTVKMTGKELKTYLAQVFALALPNAGSYPHFSGLQAVYYRGAKRFEKLTLAHRPIEDNQLYTVAISNFLVEGGDKYPDLRKSNPQTYGFTDADIVKEYLAAHSPLMVAPPLGEIVIRN